MRSSPQLTATPTHDHSLACLTLGTHHARTSGAVTQALGQGRRLLVQAIAHGDWDAASHLEEQLVVTEDRLAQHLQQLNELADRVCDLRSRAQRPAA